MFQLSGFYCKLFALTLGWFRVGGLRSDGLGSKRVRTSKCMYVYYIYLYIYIYT